VTLLQAVASLPDWLLTGFPLESGLAAQLSRIAQVVLTGRGPAIE
jgi:hypothetical protein